MGVPSLTSLNLERLSKLPIVLPDQFSFDYDLLGTRLVDSFPNITTPDGFEEFRVYPFIPRQWVDVVEWLMQVKSVNLSYTYNRVIGVDEGDEGTRLEISGSGTIEDLAWQKAEDPFVENEPQQWERLREGFPFLRAFKQEGVDQHLRRWDADGVLIDDTESTLLIDIEFDMCFRVPNFPDPETENGKVGMLPRDNIGQTELNQDTRPTASVRVGVASTLNIEPEEGEEPDQVIVGYANVENFNIDGPGVPYYAAIEDVSENGKLRSFSVSANVTINKRF